MIALGGITAILGVCWYLTKTPQREAERVIRSLWTVQLGKTSVDELIRTARGRWTTGLRAISDLVAL